MNTFKCNLWTELNKILKTEVKFVPTYHQATNGLVERSHQAIKNSLRAQLIEIGDTKREKWMDFLPFVMMGRRVAVQQDIQVSPSQLAFGEQIRIPGQLVNPENELDTVDNILKQVQANVKRKPIFVGEMVIVSMKNLVISVIVSMALSLTVLHV